MDELKRRNVFRVGIAYVVVDWLTAQVADLVLDNIDAPHWLMQAIAEKVNEQKKLDDDMKLAL